MNDIAYWAIGIAAALLATLVVVFLRLRKSMRHARVLEIASEQVQLAFAVVDREGKVIEANEAFCRVAGSVDQIRNQPVLDSADALTRKLAESTFDRAVNTAKSQVCDRSLQIGEHGCAYVFSVGALSNERQPQWLVTLRETSSRESEEERKAMEHKVARLERRVLDVVEEEQRRIGQDLHDGIGQELTGLNMMADTLVEQLERAERPEATIARRILEKVRDTAVQVRGISRGLVSFETVNSGLATALRKLAEDFNESGKIACTYSGPESVDIPDKQVATELFRIAQEAVSNAVKHASATAISLTLEQVKGGEITLHVSDNGEGIEAPAETTGSGLRIMRHRARIAGADFKVISPEGGGTVIRCNIKSPSPSQ